MICPRCGGNDVIRTLKHERAGYEAAIMCLACDRQVCVIRDELGEAVDDAGALFFGGGGRDG